MSSYQDEPKTRASVDFAETSLLDTIVPFLPDLEIEDAFQAWDGTASDQNSSLLPFIEQRHFLLFGKVSLTLQPQRSNSYSFLGY